MYCQYGELEKLTKLGARMLLLLPAWRPATTSLDVDIGMCWQPLSLQTHLMNPDQRRADVRSCPCSDGNLVASLLSHRLGITQVGCRNCEMLHAPGLLCPEMSRMCICMCAALPSHSGLAEAVHLDSEPRAPTLHTQANIAHALEKTKYTDADINW